MRLRTFLTVIATTAASLALAAPALAGAGEGLAGETNDKVVTFFCLGVLLFFVLTVFVGTFIQASLEKKKDAQKAAHSRQRVGW
jgi:hypothetical protein